MRYMSFVISSSEVQPTPELMEAMGKLTEREIKAGRLLDMGGLMPIDGATRVTLKKGKLGVTDGPFTEAKEVVGGFAVFEFATKEEAVAAAVEFMDLHKQFCPGWEGMCEVRAIVPEGEQGSCGAQVDVSSAA
jgi:hypothetical protein